MRSMWKSCCLLPLFILILSNLYLIGVTTAQSIAKPSVPEFTVKIVSNPYLVPETNSTDPYTGQVTIYPAHTNENKSVEVTVQNQQFTSTQLPDGNWTQLYYNIRYEGHFIQDDWTYYPLASKDGYINASKSEYTVIPIPTYQLLATYANGTQIDFQVQALIGHDEAKYSDGYWVGNNFTGEYGDWSPIATLIFGEPLNANPTPSSTVPELSWLVILPLFAATFVIAVKMKRRCGKSIF